MKQKFIEREYGENILKEQTDQVDNIDRRDLLRKKEKSNRTPCLVMYNRDLPVMCKVGVFFKNFRIARNISEQSIRSIFRRLYDKKWKSV